VAEPLASWEAVRDFALSLAGTELPTSYGKPAVKVAASGRAFVFPGREADTSFAVALDLGSIDLLKEAEPETYWQSPHYEGWGTVLVRQDSPDPGRVRAVIRQAHEQAAQMKPVRKRQA
jgi:hypothetical protein